VVIKQIEIQRIIGWSLHAL